MNLVKENKFSSYFVYKHLTSLEKIKVAVLSKYRFKLIWVLQLLFFHRKKVFSLLTSYRPNAIKKTKQKNSEGQSDTKCDWTTAASYAKTISKTIWKFIIVC